VREGFLRPALHEVERAPFVPADRVLRPRRHRAVEVCRSLLRAQLIEVAPVEPDLQRLTRRLGRLVRRCAPILITLIELLAELARVPEMDAPDVVLGHEARTIGREEEGTGADQPGGF